MTMCRRIRKEEPLDHDLDESFHAHSVEASPSDQTQPLPPQREPSIHPERLSSVSSASDDSTHADGNTTPKATFRPKQMGKHTRSTPEEEGNVSEEPEENHTEYDAQGPSTAQPVAVAPALQVPYIRQATSVDMTGQDKIPPPPATANVTPSYTSRQYTDLSSENTLDMFSFEGIDDILARLEMNGDEVSDEMTGDVVRSQRRDELCQEFR